MASSQPSRAVPKWRSRSGDGGRVNANELNQNKKWWRGINSQNSNCLKTFNFFHPRGATHSYVYAPPYGEPIKGGRAGGRRSVPARGKKPPITQSVNTRVSGQLLLSLEGAFRGPGHGWRGRSALRARACNDKVCKYKEIDLTKLIYIKMASLPHMIST